MVNFEKETDHWFNWPETSTQVDVCQHDINKHQLMQDVHTTIYSKWMFFQQQKKQQFDWSSDVKKDCI